MSDPTTHFHCRLRAVAQRLDLLRMQFRHWIRLASVDTCKRLDNTLDVDVGELEVLPADERQLMVQTWNATQRDHQEHLCIHHLFEQQVKLSPEATALVFVDQQLSYAELNGRANRLAYH